MPTEPGTGARSQGVITHRTAAFRPAGSPMNPVSYNARFLGTIINHHDNAAIIDVPRRQRLHLYKAGSIAALVLPARIASTRREAMGEQTGDHNHDHEHAHNESGQIHDAHTDFDHDHDHDDHDDHGGHGHEH